MKRQRYTEVAAIAQERRVATRAPTVHSDVVVPALAAVISGLLVGTVAGLVWWLLTGDQDAAQVGIVVGLLVAVFLWFALLIHGRSLLFDVQRIVPEEPQQVQMPVPPVRLPIMSQDGHTIYNADLEATQDQLARLAEGLLAGKPLTEAQWSGAGKPFSVEQFRNIRQEMQGAGLIRPKSEKDARQGYTLTPSGRAAMKRLAPSPDSGVGA